MRSDRVARKLVRLYPRRWRERYETEMLALIEETPAGWRQALDLARACAGQWIQLIAGPDGSSASRTAKTVRALVIVVAIYFVAGAVGHVLTAEAAAILGRLSWRPGPTAVFLATLVHVGIMMRILLFLPIRPDFGPFLGDIFELLLDFGVPKRLIDVLSRVGAVEGCLLAAISIAAASLSVSVAVQTGLSPLAFDVGVDGRMSTVLGWLANAAFWRWRRDWLPASSAVGLKPPRSILGLGGGD